MTQRPFRFGVVTAQAPTGQAWAEKARRIEALGYATLVMPDSVAHGFAPFPALAAAAAATSTARLGTYVLANDYRNPILVAKDAATLDVLCEGRFELGLGAGRPSAAHDNRMLGLPFDPGAVRVARLVETITLVKALFAGERVSAHGPHYTATEAQIAPRPRQQPWPPLLVAGSGHRLLALAAREADIVALGVGPDETETAVAEKIQVLRAAAGQRFDQLEINVNLVAVGGQVVRYVAAQYGADATALARSDAISVLAGTTDEMCARLVARRDALGISYVMVSEELMEAFAPVVARLAGH